MKKKLRFATFFLYRLRVSRFTKDIRRLLNRYCSILPQIVFAKGAVMWTYVRHYKVRKFRPENILKKNLRDFSTRYFFVQRSRKPRFSYSFRSFRRPFMSHFKRPIPRNVRASAPEPEETEGIVSDMRALADTPISEPPLPPLATFEEAILLPSTGALVIQTPRSPYNTLIDSLIKSFSEAGVPLILQRLQKADAKTKKHKKFLVPFEGDWTDLLLSAKLQPDKLISANLVKGGDFICLDLDRADPAPTKEWLMLHVSAILETYRLDPDIGAPPLITETINGFHLWFRRNEAHPLPSGRNGALCTGLEVEFIQSSFCVIAGQTQKMIQFTPLNDVPIFPDFLLPWKKTKETALFTPIFERVKEGRRYNLLHELILNKQIQNVATLSFISSYLIEGELLEGELEHLKKLIQRGDSSAIEKPSPVATAKAFFETSLDIARQELEESRSKKGLKPLPLPELESSAIEEAQKNLCYERSPREVALYLCSEFGDEGGIEQLIILFMNVINHAVFYHSERCCFCVYNANLGYWRMLTDSQAGEMFGAFIMDLRIPSLNRLAFINNVIKRLSQSLGRTGVVSVPGLASKSGFLRFSTGLIEPSSPYHYALRSINHSIDSTTELDPVVAQWLSNFVAGEPHQGIVLRLCFYLSIFKITEAQVGFFFIGSPGGGKSTLVDTLRLMIGTENIYSVSSFISETMFMLQSIKNAGLITFEDFSGEVFNPNIITLLRNVLGGDKITASKKNAAEHIVIEGGLNVLLHANAAPTLGTNTDFLLRRLFWLHTGGFQEKFKKVDLRKAIGLNIAGILNWVINTPKQFLLLTSHAASISLLSQDSSWCSVTNWMIRSDSDIGFNPLAESYVASMANTNEPPLHTHYLSFCTDKGWNDKLAIKANGFSPILKNLLDRVAKRDIRVIHTRSGNKIQGLIKYTKGTKLPYPLEIVQPRLHIKIAVLLLCDPFAKELTPLIPLPNEFVPIYLALKREPSNAAWMRPSAAENLQKQLETISPIELPEQHESISERLKSVQEKGKYRKKSAILGPDSMDSFFQKRHSEVDLRESFFETPSLNKGLNTAPLFNAGAKEWTITKATFLRLKGMSLTLQQRSAFQAQIFENPQDLIEWQMREGWEPVKLVPSGLFGCDLVIDRSDTFLYDPLEEVPLGPQLPAPHSPIAPVMEPFFPSDNPVPSPSSPALDPFTPSQREATLELDVPIVEFIESSEKAFEAFTSSPSGNERKGKDGPSSSSLLLNDTQHCEEVKAFESSFEIPKSNEEIQSIPEKKNNREEIMFRFGDDDPLQSDQEAINPEVGGLPDDLIRALDVVQGRSQTTESHKTELYLHPSDTPNTVYPLDGVPISGRVTEPWVAPERINKKGNLMGVPRIQTWSLLAWQYIPLIQATLKASLYDKVLRQFTRFNGPLAEERQVWEPILLRLMSSQICDPLNDQWGWGLSILLPFTGLTFETAALKLSAAEAIKETRRAKAIFEIPNGIANFGDHIETFQKEAEKYLAKFEDALWYPEDPTTFDFSAPSPHAQNWIKIQNVLAAFATWSTVPRTVNGHFGQRLQDGFDLTSLIFGQQEKRKENVVEMEGNRKYVGTRKLFSKVFATDYAIKAESPGRFSVGGTHYLTMDKAYRRFVLRAFYTDSFFEGWTLSAIDLKGCHLYLAAGMATKELMPTLYQFLSNKVDIWEQAQSFYEDPLQYDKKVLKVCVYGILNGGGSDFDGLVRHITKFLSSKGDSNLVQIARQKALPILNHPYVKELGRFQQWAKNKGDAFFTPLVCEPIRKTTEVMTTNSSDNKTTKLFKPAPYKNASPLFTSWEFMAISLLQKKILEQSAKGTPIFIIQLMHDGFVVIHRKEVNMEEIGKELNEVLETWSMTALRLKLTASITPEPC